MTSIQDILGKLDKNTLSKVKLGSEITTEAIPTASFALNNMLGGGFRKGKQHTIWGGEQGSKSSFMLQTVGINQKRGELCAWIDAEHSYDPIWAEKLGVDNENIIISEISTIEELTDMQRILIGLGVGLIVVDSTSALMPKSYFDKGGNLKDFADTGQMGAVAKDLGQMCKMIQGINYSCAVVHISQERIDVGSPSMHKPRKPVGGKEVEHTDSFRIRMMGGKTDAAAIKDDVMYGDVLVEEKIGIPVDWIINKNKINGRYGNGKYQFFIAGDHLGLNKEEEILREAIKYGVARSSGAWFYIDEGKFQGADNAYKYLRENPDRRDALEKEVLNVLQSI